MRRVTTTPVTAIKRPHDGDLYVKPGARGAVWALEADQAANGSHD